MKKSHAQFNSKFLYILIIFVSVISFILGTKISSPKQKLSTSGKAQQETSTTTKDFAIQKDNDLLSSFRQSVLINNKQLQELNEKEKIIKVSLMNNETLKKIGNVRSTQLDNDFWVIETIDHNTTVNNTRTEGVSRFVYTFTNNKITKITNSSPVPCFVDKMDFVGAKDDRPINSKLKEDVIVLSGPCDNGYSFISAHKYDTGEQIKFSDNKALSRNINLGTMNQDKLVTPDGTLYGKLQEGAYGSEPVIVVHIDSVLDFSPSNKGVAIFSLRTGILLNLIDYSAF